MRLKKTPHSRAIYFLCSSFMALIFGLTLSSCGNNYSEAPRPPSQAFQKPQTTFQGQLFLKEAKKHPGKSGFSLLAHGQEAFEKRMSMIRLAEKSLDLQYYIWEPDITGHLLTYELIKAADRGVRVRILVDDLGLKGRDQISAELDAHPNIQIRIYNPFSYRKSRMLNFLTEFDRLNHRMHNKVIVADNAVSIIGGRNIGDHYFSISEEGNFRDLDMICAGPVVRDISKVYDYFWNADWAVPIKTIFSNNYNDKHLAKSRKRLQKRIKNNPYPHPFDMSPSKLATDMRKLRSQMVWAHGSYVWNDPKELQRKAELQQGTLIKKFAHQLDKTQDVVRIDSPYFIPGESGVARLKSLVDRGVEVRILTNSLRSNDVLPSHAGYAKYRKSLIEAGVHLYELRPDAKEGSKRSKISFSGSKSAGLHTKAFMFDHKFVFIGSFNLDPRSAQINSEGGLFVQSEKLAQELLNYMKEDENPRNSYKVELDSAGNLIWITEKNGKKLTFTHEPNSGLWSNIKVHFIQWLPVEDQL